MKLKYLIASSIVFLINNIFAVPVVDIAWEDGYNIQGMNNTGKDLIATFYADMNFFRS